MKSNENPNQVTIDGTLDDRIDILFRELELAIRWQRPSILLAVVPSASVRDEAQLNLKQRLLGVGQDVHAIKMENKRNSDVAQSLAHLRNQEAKVVFVDGFSSQNEKERLRSFHALNAGRDYFINRQVRIVFWVSEKDTSDLARQAPDFWGYRHRVVEFLEQHDPRQSPLRMLGTVWQGIGEIAGDMGDIDNRIAMRESLMAELPEKNESTSIRANLLVALGVLNWRKGDFKKAVHYSRTAIKLASLMEDKWFEAVCFNSLALIQANTGSVSEAVEDLTIASKLAPDQIFPWNNLGNLFTELDRFDEAMEAFQAAMQRNPQNAVTLNGLGNVNYKLGHRDAALGHYQKAIQLAPTFAHPWNGIGTIYSEMNRMDAAISAFEKSIQLDDQLASPWVNLGRIYENEKRLDEAAQAFHKAYELDPSSAVVWHEQGRIYLNKGSFDEAVCAFQKSIELDHGNGWSYANLAQTYVCKGKYSEAIQLYHKSLKLLKTNSEKAITWSRISNVYQRNNDLENAISAKQIALQLDPGNDQLKNELIEIHNSLLLQGSNPVAGTKEAGSQEKDSTAQSVTDVNKSNPVAARERNEHGNALVYSGAFQQAGAAYRKAIELDAGFGWPYANLAMIAMHDGKFSEAIPLYQKSLELLASRQERSVIWNRLGNAYRRMNDYVKAIQAHRKSLTQDPGNTTARQALLVIHNELGQLKNTTDQLTASLDKATAWNMLGSAYRRLNDYSSATEAYQKAVDLAPGDHAFRFDLEEAFKDSRKKGHSVKASRAGRKGWAGSISESIPTATPVDYVDDDQPGPFGELVDIDSVPEIKVAKTGDAFNPNLESLSSFPIGQPAKRPSDPLANRRSIIINPVPVVRSNSTPSISSELTPLSVPGFQNNWQVDQQRLSVQLTGDSGVVDSINSPVVVQNRVLHMASASPKTVPNANELVDITRLPEPAPVIRDQRVIRPLQNNNQQVAMLSVPPEQGKQVENSEQRKPAPSIQMNSPLPKNTDPEKLERDITAFKTVTTINPNNARAWHSLGNLQRSAGQYAEAALSLEKAVEIEPKQEVFHYHLGLVYAAQEQYEKAIASFNHVITLNPNYNLAHATLAGYYRKMGQEKDYKYHMTIARRTMNEEKEYNRSCFEAICGNVEKAIDLLNIALKEKQTNLEWVRRDPDFDNIRCDKRFQVLLSG